jgi:hypothetical protein
VRHLAVFVIFLVGVLVAADCVAEDRSRLRFLGTIEQNRALLQQGTNGQNLLISPRVAYVLVHRLSPNTVAQVRYRGGERTLPFPDGSTAQLRVVIQQNQAFSVLAHRAHSLCFAQQITVNRSGVWQLDLPC